MTLAFKFPAPLVINVNVTGLSALPPAGLADALNALEVKVSALSDKIAEFTAAVTAGIDRVAVDVAELKRQVAEGTATPADFAALDAGIAQLKGLDPLPEFPAPAIGSGTDTVDAGSGGPPVTPA